MVTRVEFMSMAKAEALEGAADWAVISITEPGKRLADLQPGWHKVLRLQFHDVDSDDALGYKLFSKEDAQAVLSFVEETASKVDGILVHCFAGVSRSAAIAKCIAELYGLYFPESYSIYNKQIYRRINQVRWEAALDGSAE